MKINDVEDLDKNWQSKIPCHRARMQKSVLLGSAVLLAVRSRTFRGRTDAQIMCIIKENS